MLMTKKVFQKTSMLYLRFAEPEDVKDLFNWRNDPATRQASFNTDEISFEEHKKWFEETLADPKINLFIICDKDCNKLGQIRFDKKEDFAEINITINPNYRNQGVGSLALSKSLGIYINNFDVKQVIAKVKKDNVASLKAFQTAGFQIHEDFTDYIELQYEQ
jgi:UDP-2,4-diacetamido-2,4,6-trideoxy-beta-L-altropyranose hydrolase